MKLRIVENGPIVVDTDAELVLRVAGDVQRKPGPVFLCRCGQSSDKPFCDGTHRKAGFEGPAGEVELA